MQTQAKIRHLLSDLQIKAPAGFAIGFHINFTTPRYLFQTYAKDWLAHYNQNGLVMQDPIVAWTFANNGTIRWSELEKLFPGQVLSDAKTFGLAYGFACGIERGDTRSVAGFARPDREYTDAEIVDMAAMAATLHDLTATAKTLDPGTREALRKMSIQFTHP